MSPLLSRGTLRSLNVHHIIFLVSVLREILIAIIALVVSVIGLPIKLPHHVFQVHVRLFGRLSGGEYALLFLILFIARRLVRDV